MKTITPAKSKWICHYWDLRMYARIACHANDKLVAMRGFGRMRKMWNRQTLVGRRRSNDDRVFVETTNQFTDHNPNRIIP